MREPKILSSPIMAILFFIVFLSGCGVFSMEKRGIVTKKWTLLVYMNADNDLDGAAIEDLNEMEMAGSTGDVNIIVQVDRSKMGSWTGTRRYYVTKDDNPASLHSIMLQDLSELDMGNPQTLKEFIQWTQKYYPANHYCLVIWNHGAGWRKMRKQVNRGISQDDTSNSTLRVSDLEEALNIGAKLNLIIIDECLMQMVEAAYEIKDYANFLAASEENEPSDGLPYDIIFAALVNNPNVSPGEFAKEAAQSYIAYYLNEDQSGLTYSVVNLSGMSNLTQKIDEFASTMKQKIEAGSSEIKTQIEQARNAAQYYDRETGKYTDYRDLYHFAQLVKQKVNDETIKIKAQGVLDVIKNPNLIVYNGTTGDTNSYGLAISLPTASEFRSSYSEYSQLQFAKNTNWDEFLAIY